MTRRELEQMSYSEREAYIKKLQDEVLGRLEALFGKAPAPVDDIDDDAQIDNLRRLWGES